MKKRLNKSILSFILVLFLFLPIFQSYLLVFSAASGEFLSGDGSENNPYRISTKEHLNNVRNYRYAHFLLVNNIVFAPSDFAQSGAFYNNGAGWAPIGEYTGSNDGPFSGTFDGGGFQIHGLKVHISQNVTVYAGLFGYNKGTIKNLGVINASVSCSTNTSNNIATNTFAGGIAAYSSGTIINCYSTGTVTAVGRMAYAGGIAGQNYGTIENCYNTGTIKSTIDSVVFSSFTAISYSGGIAGYNFRTISNCHNTGTVSADIANGAYGISRAGGIVGENQQSTVSDCYNSGTVTASADSSSSSACAGGIAAYHYASFINRCYNTGTATATSINTSYAGGITGHIMHGNLNSCYNAGTVTVNTSLPKNASNTAAAYAGGISGYVTDSNLSNCYNTGAITANAIGLNYNVPLDLLHSDSNSTILPLAKANTGGIAGFIAHGDITLCYNTGALKATTTVPSAIAYTAGIVGDNR